MMPFEESIEIRIHVQYLQIRSIRLSDRLEPLVTSAMSLLAFPRLLSSRSNLGHKVDSPPPVSSMAGIPASTICLGSSSAHSASHPDCFVLAPIGFASSYFFPGFASISSSILLFGPSSIRYAQNEQLSLHHASRSTCISVGVIGWPCCRSFNLDI